MNPNSSEEWSAVQNSTLNVSDSTNSLFSTLKQSDVKMNTLVSSQDFQEEALPEEQLFPTSHLSNGVLTNSFEKELNQSNQSGSSSAFQVQGQLNQIYQQQHQQALAQAQALHAHQQQVQQHAQQQANAQQQAHQQLNAQQVAAQLQHSVNSSTSQLLNQPVALSTSMSLGSNNSLPSPATLLKNEPLFQQQLQQQMMQGSAQMLLHNLPPSGTPPRSLPASTTVSPSTSGNLGTTAMPTPTVRMGGSGSNQLPLPSLPLLQPNQLTQQGQLKMQEVSFRVQQIAKELEEMRIAIRQLNNTGAIPTLLQRQQALQAAIIQQEQTLTTVLDSVLLPPLESYHAFRFQNDLMLQKKQLEVYNSDLLNMQKQSFLPSACLVILSQPFPESVKQNKVMDDAVEVKVLFGARTQLPNQNPPAIAKAELINFEATKGKKSASGLENVDKPINREGLSVFNDLKFPSGTRLKTVRLRFSAKITIIEETTQKASLVQLETAIPSNPILVKTNENQWGEAEGLLLKHSIFESAQQQAPWCRFANWLQRRYLMATKQNLQNPQRPLTPEDFLYISRLKFGSGSPSFISLAQFESFWEWFGPALHKIRYQRHLCTLWISGIVPGFLTREEADVCLKNEQPSTFLLRFSERAPGKFAVAYRSSDFQTRHYLLKSDDVFGAKKTLPDFLRDYDELQTLLQLNPITRQLNRVDKSGALREFYSKREESSIEGYDEEIR